MLIYAMILTNDPGSIPTPTIEYMRQCLGTKLGTTTIQKKQEMSYNENTYKPNPSVIEREATV